MWAMLTICRSLVTFVYLSFTVCVRAFFCHTRLITLLRILSNILLYYIHLCIFGAVRERDGRPERFAKYKDTILKSSPPKKKLSEKIYSAAVKIIWTVHRVIEIPGAIWRSKFACDRQFSRLQSLKNKPNYWNHGH